MSDEQLLRHLRVGPAYLLLGNAFLEPDVVPGLSQSIGTKFEAESDLDACLSETLLEDPTSAWAWMDRRATDHPISATTKAMLDYPWSGLVVSTPFSTWVDHVRNSWREISPVFETRQISDEPRSKTRLTTEVLFGSVRWSESMPPPTTSLSVRRRLVKAAAILNRLPETLTPRGLLFVVGWRHDDWLTPDYLLPAVAELGVGQVHIFEPDHEIQGNEDFASLVAAGIITVHSDSLGAIIQRGVSSGVLSLAPPSMDGGGLRLEIESGAVAVPKALLNTTSKSALIVGDDPLHSPKPLSPSASYAAYREFLLTSDGLPNWSGFQRGFAFQREFEEALWDEATKAMNAKDLQDRPIVIHGPSGSGKSVAAAALAARMRCELKYPVLYIQRRTQPVIADLEAFCRWAEAEGAGATLVIWDGQLSSDEYGDAARYLASKGRKAVVVGTSYRTTSRFGRLVEAPPILTASEREGFRLYLSGVLPDSEQRVSEILAGTDDDRFLVSLYRLLPSTRRGLRSGIDREVQRAESQLVSQAREMAPELPAATAMQRALIDAGILDETDLVDLETVSETFEGEDLTLLQKLTGLIVVPGQFGLNVPVELLIRSLGQEGYEYLAELLQEVDVFHWYEDQVGNIEIGPRHPIEAQMVVEARLGRPSMQVRFIRTLLESVAGPGERDRSSREIRFASNLLQAIDPNRSDRTYLRYFPEVSRSLRYLREERGLRHPQLMLQEGHLLREWVKSSEDLQDASVDTAINDAIEVLELALETDRTRPYASFTRVNLWTELASSYAVRARRGGEHDASQEAVLADFQSSREAVNTARTIAPDTYYPIDVLAWATMDLAKTGILSDTERAEAAAELLLTFGTTDPFLFGAASAERFLRRQIEVGAFIGDTTLSEASFDELRRLGSPAGVVLRAAEMAGGRVQDDWNREGARAALAYLDGFQDLAGSIRLEELRLDLWWRSMVGERLFARERVALRFMAGDWQDLHRQVLRIQALGSSARELHLLFLRGLCEFHLQDFSGSLATFREVDRVSESIRSRWKVVRSYVASDYMGEPRRFNGLITSTREGGRWAEVFVEQLQISVSARIQDFAGMTFEQDQALEEFTIAFSMQGPIADSYNSYIAARRRDQDIDPAGRMLGREN